MISEDGWTETYLRRVGWDPVSVQPAGFVGVRVEGRNLESGQMRLIDILDGSDQTTYVLSINSSYARNWSPIYTAGPVAGGWLAVDEHLSYDVLNMDANARRLSELPRDVYAGSIQAACETSMQLVKCVEWIARNQSCHLAICPSSVYYADQRFRIGELWYCHAFNGAPFFLSTDRSAAIIEARTQEAKAFGAPELIDGRSFGCESDDYSMALLALYVFCGYRPNGSVENASDRQAAIRALCPELDDLIAGELARALSPEPGERTNCVDLKCALAAFGQRIGIPLSEAYLAKAL